jgi:hypothetical protein
MRGKEWNDSLTIGISSGKAIVAAVALLSLDPFRLVAGARQKRGGIDDMFGILELCVPLE